MAGVAAGIGRALPLVGSGLGLISKIGGGIAGLFNRNGKNKHARRAQEFFGGMGRVATAVGGRGYSVPEAAQRVGGIARGAQNMVSRGREAIDYGGQFAGGMRDAFQRRDFGGMTDMASRGMERFGQIGRGMIEEGQNMYNQGRDAYRFGRGVFNDMRDRYRGGYGAEMRGPSDIYNRGFGMQGPSDIYNRGFGMQEPANGITDNMLVRARRRLRPVRML
jgi:hypothetical protein